MQRIQNKLIINGLITLALALVFLIIPATPVLAQRAPSPTELKERRGTIMDENLQIRGAVREEKIGQTGHQTNEKQLRAVMEQTIQDFDRIQAIDREYMLALMEKKAFDYKSLTEMMTEIRKRARRLKDNMNLPPPTDKEPARKKWDEIGQAEMKDALLALDDVIGSFVTNPMFQTSNWLDVPLGRKASRDLEDIIELSANIKKGAELLSKPQK